MDEFEIIRNHLSKLSKKNESTLNLNDDVFFDKKNKLVVTTDTYLEGVHFINFNHPNLIIKKAIRSSISDLICKGVFPKFIFVAASGNKNSFSKNKIIKLTNSIKKEQKKYNFILSGGDTTYSTKISFTVTAIGISKKIVKRNNAKINDDIYITGNLGDSYVGLLTLKKKLKIPAKHKKYFIDKFFSPDLPFKFTKYLTKVANTSMDISDGLFGDLNKLINNQNLTYKINSDILPISKKLSEIIKINKVKSLDFVTKGDDYQILFSANKNKRKILKSISKRINLKITRIGNIVKGNNPLILSKDKKIVKSNIFDGYLHKF